MGYGNLDLRCARAAAEMVQEASPDNQLEKLCLDANAVLSANGPYAFFLYLRSREEKSASGAPKSASAAPMIDTCYRALAEWFPALFSHSASDRGQMLGRIAALSEDLDSLLLAKKLLSRILTYARYHAKTASAISQSASSAQTAQLENTDAFLE